MKPSQLTALLATMIPAREPVLITGAPGVGKSDVVEQARKAAGADLIISHPAVADPTDAKGLPWPGKDGKSATFLPFGELRQAMDAKVLTVWFLDDLGQAPAAVQAAYMQLLLARRVNGHKLPDCVTFLAATNRRTDRAGVGGILEPVKSRFTTIVELEADLNDWCMWAFAHMMPAELIAFLRFRQDLLCAFKASADLTNSPVPRTWAAVGRMMQLGMPNDIQHVAFSGAVGEGPAAEFGGFLRMFREMPTIDGILLDPAGAKLPDQPATLYAVVTALGMRSNEQTFNRIAQYATRMVDSGRAEFAALLVRDAVRKDSAVQNTEGFTRLASGDLGRLISGEAR